MSKYKYSIYTGLLIIILLLTTPYVWKLFCILFLSSKVPVLSQLELYKWVATGMLIAFIVGRYMNRNMKWLQTFSHELTHIVVALLFFRKVHSFQAEEECGAVITSSTTEKGIIPMALAPYCLPIFTYLLLIIRSLIDFHGMWFFDIIVGITLAFHISCFKHQTSPHQTDINQYPIFFSYTYIYVARVINGCIIVVAFFPGYNVFTSTWRLLCAMYENIIVSYEWISLTFSDIIQ